MLRLFISQSMKDKTDEEIIETRKRAIEIAKRFVGTDVEIIDSFFQNAPHDVKPLWFLGKAIELLSTADIVFFAKGWEEARGCRIEHQCAYAYGIRTIEES